MIYYLNDVELSYAELCQFYDEAFINETVAELFVDEDEADFADRSLTIRRLPDGTLDAFRR